MPGGAVQAGTVRLRIDLAYDGTGFRGFARQRGQRTVQGLVEDALERVTGTPVGTTCAGRTDAGVHATAQTVHCDLPSGNRVLGDLESARRSLDRLCGPEVTIWRVRRVPTSFDARFSAVRRVYRYRVCDAAAVNPLWRHDTWHVGPPRLDVDAMGAAASHLLGEHDFSSFCRRQDGRHLVRRIDSLEVRRPAAPLVVIEVAGPAFCHQMVRSITGCLVAVGQGRRAPRWIDDVLRARDRQAAGAIAPPHGLTLVHVTFGGRAPRGAGRAAS